MSDKMAAAHLRWGVLGCGVIAHQMGDALAAEGRRMDGVANRTYEKAQAFAADYHIPKVYARIEDLFADPDIDAVYITTPHNTHITYLRQALSAGKHVMCEKSITLNSKELDEAKELAAEHEVVLMDACTILHMPLYKELGRRLKQGEFGPVNLIQENFGSYKNYDMNNRFFNPKLAGGAMLDIGVYSLSLARLFLSSCPDEWVSLENAAPTGVDETEGIVARNSEGQMVVLSLSLHSKQPKRAMISCDRCFIEIMEYPRADEATITWTHSGEREVVRVGQSGRALNYVLADLEEAVANRQLAHDNIAISSDVMHMMTGMRYDWGFKYPEES